EVALYSLTDTLANVSRVPQQRHLVREGKRVDDLDLTISGPVLVTLHHPASLHVSIHLHHEQGNFPANGSWSLGTRAGSVSPSMNLVCISALTLTGRAVGRVYAIHSAQ